jgi:hypothetical protein
MKGEGGPPPGVDMEKLAGYLRRQEFQEQQDDELKEAGSTRDFSFAGSARELGFPERQWDNPEVRRFVGVWNHLLQIRHDIPPSATSVSPLTVKRLDLGAHDGEVDLGPAPLERYQAVDHLLGAAFLILQEGLPSVIGSDIKRLRNTTAIGHAVNRALRSYGLRTNPAKDER